MNIIKIIKEEYSLLENIQLADKVYFNTGLLSNEDKEFILGITNGDHFTKIMSDIYYYVKENNIFSKDKYIFKNDYNTININEIYNELKVYNKNLLPLKDFDIYKNNSKNIYSVINYFNNRNYIKQILNKLPSTAVRNIRNELRTERNFKELKDYTNKFNYLTLITNQLSNRPENIKNKILNKAFKSNNTIDDIIDFFDEKSNLVGSVGMTKKQLLHVLDNTISSYLKYNKGNIIVVDVQNHHDLKKLACNSLWCFTYGRDNWKDFNKYSYEGSVYLIFNFSYSTDDDGFSYTVIKPPKMFEDIESEYFDDEEDYDDENVYMYDHFNNPIDIRRSRYIMEDLFGSMENVYKIFNFE